MIGILILKDLHSYLKRFHFYLLTVILLLLFVINGIFYSQEYVEQTEYYERNAKVTYPSPTSRFVRIPPSASMFCCSNNVNLASISFWIRLDQLSISLRDEEKGNQFLPVSQSMDWTFIVQVIFSILIVMISYNAISEEKEKKTLALIGSNSISRFQIYLSKFSGLFLISSCILLISMLAGLITIFIIGLIPVNSALLARLGIFYILSMLYGCIFIMIGLSCSVLTHKSTISLLAAMSLWLFLVILLPESIDIAVESTQNRPSNYELQRMYDEVEFDFIKTRFNEVVENIESKSQYSEAEKNRIIEDTKNIIIKLDNEHVINTNKTINYIFNVHIERFNKQQQWKKLSPAILFRIFSEKLFYNGKYKFLDMMEQIERFSTSFQEDMYNKYGAREERFSIIRTEINGEAVRIQPDSPKFEYNNIEFQARKPDLRESLSLMLNELILMLLIFSGLGVFGFIKFIRYDIR